MFLRVAVEIVVGFEFCAKVEAHFFAQRFFVRFDVGPMGDYRVLIFILLFSGDTDESPTKLRLPGLRLFGIRPQGSLAHVLDDEGIGVAYADDGLDLALTLNIVENQAVEMRES